jgi:UDP-N-acetylmuramate--alanine ligase
VAADGRSLARALRVAGRVEPVFIDDVAICHSAIAELAHAMATLSCAWGLAPLATYPESTVELLQKSELARRRDKRNEPEI